MRAWILFVLAAMPLQAQTCELSTPTPVTCLTLDFVRALSSMAMIEEAVKAEALTSHDPIETAFYGTKSRMAAESQLRRQFARYRSAGDKHTAPAADYVEKVFGILFAWDSAGEVDIRRVARFKSSVAEMQELTAERKVHDDQAFKLLIAASGEILDASLVVEGPSTPITKRQMTLKQRDEIIAEIDRAFAGHLSVEPDGFWYSGWAATAVSIRRNLLDKGWNYIN